MKHLSDGQLRAYIDGASALPERERDVWAKHIASCPRCAQRLAVLRARGTEVCSLLDSTAPLSVRGLATANVARHRFTSYVRQKEESMNMFSRIFARRNRPMWIGVALVLTLTVAFSFAPVRALAKNFLALFRVQQIEFVEVSPVQIPDQETFVAAMQRFENVLGDEINFEPEGESQVIDETTARSLSSIQVRLPSALDEEPTITLHPGMHASMQVELERIQSLLSELGFTGISLPETLDGADVGLRVHESVVAAYGDCNSAGLDPQDTGGESSLDPDCTVYIQTFLPTLEAPEGLDTDQLGRAYLQILGMSSEEVAQFCEQVDWTTTLVVPVPRSANLIYNEVSVDGVQGTLITRPQPGNEAPEYVLTWVKDGMVYAITGVGTAEDAVVIGNSLQ